MTMDNMPSHEEIREFGQKIAGHTGREVVMEYRPSRVVLVA